MPSSSSASASSGCSSARPTPSNWNGAEAGLTSGPRMLKIVGVPSCLRTAATCFIAVCSSGAKQKQMPNSSRQASTRATSASTFTPSAASTSAEPLRLVMPRLPCLATGTPAAAVTRAAAVEILKVFEPSPPVPQVSIRSARAERMGVMPLPHGRGRPGHFGHRFALAVQGRQQPGDLLFVAAAVHDLAHRGGHLLHRQIAAGLDDVALRLRSCESLH